MYCKKELCSKYFLFRIDFNSLSQSFSVIAFLSISSAFILLECSLEVSHKAVSVFFFFSKLLSDVFF